MTDVALQRMDFVKGIYVEEDERRDAIMQAMVDQGLCDDPYTIAPNSRFPMERAYFTSEMLSKNDACTEALQCIIDADGEDDDAWNAFENHFASFMDFTWGSKWDGKKYDIVFYGVSGYTGYLSMQYIKRVSMRQDPNAYTFAFAGRTVSKVVQMRDRNFGGTDYADTVCLRMAYDDPVSVMDMCKSARAIINVAGPYMLTPGEILIDCCTWTGTHYFDINGELPWCMRLCELHEKAEKSSAIVMPNAAMAGGIPQMLTTFLVEKARTEFGQGEDLKEAINYALGGGTGAGTGGGTLASRLAMNQSADQIRMRMADPFTLGGFIPARDANGLKMFNIKAGTGQCQTRVRSSDQDSTLAKMTEDKRNGVFKAPHTYAFFDTRIARRSNALLADQYGRCWGTEATWAQHIFVTPEMMQQEAMKQVLSAQAGSGGVAGEKEALMKAGKYYKQGEGPALEDLSDAWVSMFHWIETTGGHELKAAWCGCDGYFETARVMVECTMACLHDIDECQCTSGIITSAACCSIPAIRRMVETGITWNPEGWLSADQLAPPAGSM